jgi:hypothetical protein
MRAIADETSIADLPALFDDPLGTVTARTLRSNQEARAALDRLRADIFQKSEWDRKCSAIQECLGFLKGGALQFPDFDPLSLASGVADGITDARATLVKWSCLFVSAASQLLGPRFQNFVDLIVPALFRGVTNASTMIKSCCRLAVLQIATNSQSRKTLAAILSESDPKSTDRRQLVTQALLVVHQRWAPATYQSSLTRLKTALAALKSDKSADVRGMARQIPEFEGSPRPLSPKPKEKAATARAPSPRRTPPASPPRLITIPATPADAAAVMEQLRALNEPVPRPDVARVIGEALPKAIELTPTEAGWRLIVPKMFERFPRELRAAATAIVANLGFQDAIVGGALAQYGFSAILHDLKTPSDQMRLIETVRTKFPDVEIDRQDTTYLKRVYKAARPAAPDPPASLQAVLRQIAQKLQTSEVVGDFNREIGAAETGNMQADVLAVIGDFVALLHDRSEKVVTRALVFLKNFLTAHRSIAINPLIAPLVKLAERNETVFPPVAESCLLILFQSADLEESVVPLIGPTSDVVPLLLLQLLTDATDQELGRFEHSLPQLILPLFAAEAVPIRRAAVGIYARLSVAFGSRLRSQIDRVPPVAQKMIARCADRLRK